MFAVGDVVRVIAEPPTDRHGAFWIFISGMDRTCGQEGVIYGVEERLIGKNIVYGYRLKFDSCFRLCFYEEEWLIPIRVIKPLTKEQFDEDFGELIAGVF